MKDDVKTEYINMCIKAKEIQDKWIPEEYDRVIFPVKFYNKNGKKYPVYRTEIINWSDVNQEFFIMLDGRYISLDKLKEKWILITEKHLNNTPTKLFNSFTIPKTSLLISSLISYMYIKHGKVWNGEEWIKI